jgi:signal transduction histidine kinase
MQSDSERCGLSMTLKHPDIAVVVGDCNKLRQALFNLLSNAIKFTPAGGTVEVIVEEIADDRVQLRVSDTGIGMSTDQIPIALAAFSQVDSRLARRYEGTGLGLPLTKSFIELHGGEMSVDSTLGEGTTVTITLWRQPPPGAFAGASPSLKRVA